MGKFLSLAVAFSVIALVVIAAPAAKATNFSFTGALTHDDEVQLFSFVVGATSTVTLRTWSYAGGTNAAGVAIASDGFDPILALFNSAGARIGQNDDGGASVPADAETGEHFDTFLQSSLTAGTYTVSVMQYNNFSNGPNLSDGFRQTGNPNFTNGFAHTEHCTMFIDVDGDCNNGHWAFDVLNVNSATVVPEPSSLFLLGSGLLGVAGYGRKFIFKRASRALGFLWTPNCDENE